MKYACRFSIITVLAFAFSSNASAIILGVATEVCAPTKEASQKAAFDQFETKTCQSGKEPEPIGGWTCKKVRGVDRDDSCESQTFKCISQFLCPGEGNEIIEASVETPYPEINRTPSSPPSIAEEPQTIEVSHEAHKSDLARLQSFQKKSFWQILMPCFEETRKDLTEDLKDPDLEASLKRRCICDNKIELADQVRTAKEVLAKHADWIGKKIDAVRKDGSRYQVDANYDQLESGLAECSELASSDSDSAEELSEPLSPMNFSNSPRTAEAVARKPASSPSPQSKD